MKNRTTNGALGAISVPGLVVALMVSWAAAACARGNEGPPPREDGKEPPSAADFVKRLDKDSDGKISKSEFDGPARHFSEFDKNKDGFISEDEAPTGPPPPPPGEGEGRGGRGGPGGRR